MKRLVRTFSLCLAVILLSTSVFSTVYASENDAIKSIKNHNLEVAEVDEDFIKGALIFDTVEEFEEFMEKAESEELNAKVEIVELDSNIDSRATGNFVRRTARVTFDITFPICDIVVESYFTHDNSTKTFGEFIGGDVYSTGFVLVTTVTNRYVGGVFSRGELHVLAEGDLNFNIVVEGIGTFYKKPFVASYGVTNTLKIDGPVMRGI